MNKQTGMKERPILFNAEMVRAVLDGRKTQTRRVVKPQPPPGSIWASITKLFMLPGSAIGVMRHCPYGAPGDKLWVRETWQTGKGLDKWSPNTIAHECKEAGYGKPWAPIQYIADEYQRNQDTLFDFGNEWGKKRPSIHMPRWASRILLEVVSVKVERVQEITTEDCQAEGIEPTGFGYRDYTPGLSGFVPELAPWDSFQTLWDSINAKRGYGWDTNPWVWVVEFKRITP